MVSDYKISIIIPIYNVEPYLSKCLDSVINQTHENLEVILIDDESPDRCGEICDDYASRDNRIKVIHQKNKGLSGARNAGLKIARGDYVGFIDSDDWVDKSMYQKLLTAAIDFNLDIVECNIKETNDENLTITSNQKNNVIIETNKQSYLRILKSGGFSVWRRLYKTSIVKDYEFVLNKTSEDIYFVTDNIIKANRLGYFKDILYFYRANDTGITGSSYNLRRLNDSMEAGLYLQKELTNTFDEEFNIAINKNILLKCLLHYKKLNYYSHLDPEYKNRKWIKSLINKNYFKSKAHPYYLILANKLSIKSFEVLIRFNKLRHRLFNTNKF